MEDETTTNTGSNNSDINTYQIVTSIVYHAFISLCGREFKGMNNNNKTDHYYSCCCYSCCGNRVATTTTSSDVTAAATTDVVIANHGSDKGFRGGGGGGGDGIPIEDEMTQQWRYELYQLVQNTITVRTRNGSSHLLPELRPVERTKLYDIEIRTATAYYQRYRDRTTKTTTTTTKKKKQNESMTDTNKSSVLTIYSEMGVQRNIYSAYQLAYDYVIPTIELVLQQQHHGNNTSSIFTHIRVAPSSGFICCISNTLMEQIYQATNDNNNSNTNNSTMRLELCPYCPIWCYGNKGLWWHLQQQHTMVHHTATETATIQCSRDSTAIVVYNPPLNPTNTFIPEKNRNDDDTDDDDDTKTSSSINIASQQQPQTSVTMIAYSNNIKQQAISDIYDDPWECIQHGGTLHQLTHCLATIEHYNRTVSFDWCTKRDKYGAVLLHWAAGCGSVDIVQYLVEIKGCPINIQQIGKRSYNGRTPLHWAARNGHYYTVLYLLQYVNQKQQQRVMNETTSSSSCAINSLITECVEATTMDGTTPFCWASWQGHLNVMHLLYRYNCEINTMNQFGCNAVLWAAQGSKTTTTRVLEWLIEVDCPHLVVNHSGHGVLHKGAQRGNYDICRWFIHHMTTNMIQKPYEADNDTTTNNYYHVITTMLNVFGPDNDGCTPSDLAGMENYVELAIYLSEQEQRFVRTMIDQFNFTSTSSSAISLLPKWLSPLPNGISNKYNVTKHNIWEPGGGVFRMRSVLTDE